MSSLTIQPESLEDVTARSQTKPDDATTSGLPSSRRNRHDPTVHLPAELLAEIFDMCSPPGEDGFNGLSDMTTPVQEVERLAKKYLLQLAQVCSRWHVLIMGTQMLWRTLIVDTTLWSESNVSPTMLLGLAASSLDRGGTYPLTIQVAVDDVESHGPEFLKLLCQHSQRWQQIHFWGGFLASQTIAVVRGNLPLLERLEISQTDDWLEFNVFVVAPRLTHFTVRGWGSQVPSVPWGQIRQFRYTSFDPLDLPNSLALLGNGFPALAHCYLTVNVRGTVPLIPVVSKVSGFSLTLAVDDAALEYLGAILECLTLPCLDTLSLQGIYGTDEHPLSWHQHHFLSFASRSSLDASLTSLEIARTTIDADELVACLAVLPLLEQLVVADDNDVPHNLITDSLLRRLTWTPDPACLVPRLDFVALTSLLDFSEDVYWDFVTSRLIPARWDEEFFSKGQDLEARGELNFTARLDPEGVIAGEPGL
ncbi:hypothetical protein K438DRAFT_1994707 [Mycena galopus ATCC 62051]|nr:hypothetical protein K438DRAFT_1994707 [Mycena galopus ATCC 62051]